LEKQQEAMLRKEEAAERRREATQREEYNFKMFHSLMETMMKNVNNTNDDNDSNKKRKNNKLPSHEPANMEEQETRNMEVENDVITPTPKNHNTGEEENQQISH
jgi:hypothetical protein